MSSVFAGRSDLSKKSYITTQAPNGHIYTYTRTFNGTTFAETGVLAAIDFTITPYSAYNIAGIVLRETGKKLYADANPGVSRYMVGVFIIDQDGNNVSNSLGSMYIDPNCSVFAQFNGQRPTYIPTAEDDAAGTGLDLGNPVYTRGNILSTGPTSGVGYAAGAGGAGTSVAVTGTATVGANCGQITLGSSGTFTVPAATVLTTGSGAGGNDSPYTTTINPGETYIDVTVGSLATTDVVLISFQNATDTTAVQAQVTQVGATANIFRILFTNVSTSAENLNGKIINFAVIKAVAA